MCVLDTYIVNISLPVIAHSFNVGTTIVARIVIVYLLVLTSTIPVFGKLGDRMGFTRVLTAGFITFTFGSLLCGISTSINMLILSRCIQAIGGAMLYALPAAIIQRFLPAEIRGVSFGTLTTFGALGLSLGAPLGGILATHFSWHFIFLINVPVGITVVFLINKFFPKDHGARQAGHYFDIPGVFFSFFGLTTLLYCLNNGQKLGWTSLPIIVISVISLFLLTFFVLWEKKCVDPLLDFRLFRNRNFILGNLANFLQFMFISGSAFLMPFYLIIVKGMRADKAGFIIMSYSLVLMFAGPIAGKASDRISPRLLSSIGMLLASCSSFFFSQTLSNGSLINTVIFMMSLGLSIGFFIAPNNNHIMNSAPQEKQGTASAILKTMTNLGSAIGVCVFEIIFTLGIPDQIMKNGHSLLENHISARILLSGLHASYLVGSLICFIAFLCVFFTKDK